MTKKEYEKKIFNPQHKKDYGPAWLKFPAAFGGDDKVSGIAIRRPLGGAGCERSEQTEGVQPQSSPFRGSWHGVSRG